MHNPEDRIEDLEKLRLGVDYSFLVRIRDFSVRLRPLSISETMEVAAEVVDRYGRLPKNMQNSLSENMILAKGNLTRASRPYQGSATEPTLTEYLLDRMTPDELQLLHKEWVAGCDKVNPSLETMPIEKLDAVIQELKKNPSLVTELSFTQLANVCQRLIPGD